MNSNLYLLKISEVGFLEEPKEDLLNLFSVLPNEFRYSIKSSLKNYVFSKHFSLETLNSSPHYIADTASSALDLAHFLAKRKCFPPFSSIICRNQIEGRGQLRRTWNSEAGNLYATLSLPNIYPFSSNLASPLIGALLAKSLTKLGYDIKLKWPNDMVQQDKNGQWSKVAGILLEEKNGELMAGIGININQAPCNNHLRTDYFMPADVIKNNHGLSTIQDKRIYACDAEKNKNNFLDQSQNQGILYRFLENNLYNFNVLDYDFLKIWQFWLSLVDEIFLCYRELLFIKDEDKYSDFIDDFLAFKGEKVKISHPLVKEDLYNKSKELELNSLSGKVCGVNSQGELLLQTDCNIITILGGSFSKEEGQI